ncbi:DNA-directed RNA polymerase V subunit 1 [Iris pallida]|uniref:DNA-directed RNA polymerase n=1 Tax=Iris pallida TaxID=29817 RepID=A0AAX6GAT8_IRIPA|nr:DNA-directed RNA polymerase V subunit 1 [Iris pallida]
MEFQFDNHLKSLKVPFTSYIVQGSSLGYLTDSKSESAISKVLQQVGFLGPQLFDKGKLYSRSLVQNVYSHFVGKYSVGADPPCEAYGLVKNSFFNGLNPYEDLVHSISTREIILRSSRGLTEPGTLFKNLMAILRDVVVCYDRTVRNACSNSLIQFQYELDNEADSLSMSPAGEPVGVLAATAISTPAYKAVLDSSNSTNSAWNLMKEILLCKAGYRNDVMDRRVILYLNDCCCGKKFCKENAALAVSNCLRKVTLKECASYFTIEYQKNITISNSSEISSGLVGHVHLDISLLQRCNQSADEILQKCQEVVTGYKRKKKGNLSHIFRRLVLSASECCTFQQSQLPCLQFSYCDGSAGESLEQTMHVMTNTICPILLDTIVKGDPRIHAVNIVWVGPDVTTWVKNPSRSLKGELALEVSVEKVAARRSGDAWSTVLDACLPVMHLLNTTRSIPSGIQQIEEFLGISCAFDQSIRRLSKCLKKGVMREHLILVGSSMTCTGKLIGFNTGGFKALFRSLKVQVPFTEATLYTPMKCFQRAAEKLHSDSLGSVVSSCSWGKHVAVGTGTNFEVLWGQKHQMASNEDIGKDVYDLLAWVREPTERDYAGACLGDDVDGIFEDNENPDNSPERNTGSEPTFEGLEPDCNGSSWEKASTVNVQSDSWQGWGDKDQPTSSWGKTAQPATDNSNTSSWEKVSPAVVESVNDQGWGQSNRTNWEKATTEVIKSDNVELQKGQPASSWETAQRATKNLNMSSWEKVSSAVVKPGNDQEWGQSKRTSWENATPELANSGNVDMQNGQSASSWGTDQRATKNLNMSSWEKVSSAVVKPGNDQEWGQSNRTSWENATPELAKSANVDMQKGQPASSWGTAQPANNSNMSSWEKVSSGAVNSGNGKEWGQSNRPTWEKATLVVSVSENVDVQKGQPVSSWETAQPAKNLNMSSWEKVSPAVVKSGNDQEWGQSNRTSWEKSTPEVKSDNAEAQKHSVWTANKPEAKTMGWDDCNSGRSEKDESKGWTAQNAEEPATGSSGWNSQGWTSKKPEVDSPSEGKQGWKLGGGWGVKNSSDRRNQQNSSRPTGRPEDHKGWRRAEPFTSEEEKILVIVEPVMSSVRKILRESSDGARLSSEDHKFIIENVFHYHPDKQRKVSGEIDYITVDKHADHKETRCFYVVSSDGSRADFSYFKCMESFVDGNFPEHAESFKRKFFRRRRAEPSNAEPSSAGPSNAEPSSAEPLNGDGQQ